MLPTISRSNLSPTLETSLTTAARDQALSKRYHQRNIRKQPTDSKCSMYCKAEVHTKHSVAGRTTLMPSEYTIRHSKEAGYIHWYKVKVNQSHYRPEVPREFLEVKVPRLRANGTEWLSAFRTGRFLPPGITPDTHFCWRLSRLQGHSAIERITSMKNSNDTI